MIGTIIPKPVTDKAAFRAAMRWTCDPRNNARMYEYHDRYEVGEAPPPPEPGPEGEPEVDIDEI